MSEPVDEDRFTSLREAIALIEATTDPKDLFGIDARRTYRRLAARPPAAL